jgi:hypothetical protein
VKHGHTEPQKCLEIKAKSAVDGDVHKNPFGDFFRLWHAIGSGQATGQSPTIHPPIRSWAADA